MIEELLRFASKLALITLLFSATLPLESCGTSQKNPADNPETKWVTQPARTVDSGYIVYVAHAEDFTEEKALFKAESIALQDVANECSFVPKGTRIEDRYSEQLKNVHKVSVKVGLSYEDCEKAQNTNDPSAIKKLANAQMTDQLKHYQDLYEYQPPTSSQFAENQATDPNAGKGGLSSPSTSVQSPVQFFVARQMVVYQKEQVILAPPTAYPPGSVQSNQFARSANQSQQQLQGYQQNNPQTRTWNNTWSNFEGRPISQHPEFLQSSNFRAPSSRFEVPRSSSGPSMRNSGSGGQMKRRRRRRGF